MLAPRLGIEPRPLAVRVQSPNRWATGEVPLMAHNNHPFIIPHDGTREGYVIVSSWTFHSHVSDVYVAQNGSPGLICLGLPFSLSFGFVGSPPVVSVFPLLCIFCTHGSHHTVSLAGEPYFLHRSWGSQKCKGSSCQAFFRNWDSIICTLF